MNTLPLDKKILILNSLVEGNSIRSTERMTGVTKKAITKLLVQAGTQAREILDTQMVNIQSHYVQVDEIWTYVGKKQKRLTDEERKAGKLGDQYVFVAMDAETKLIPTFKVGKRTYGATESFIKDLQYRIVTRFQLSTDSFAPYFNVVDSVWGEDIDYGQIHKEYAEDSRGEKRYSPAQIVRVIINPLIGQPKRNHISTSYIERQNLTIRMQMRRFTRLTNAFSKKLRNLECAVALHFYHYNFMRIHQSLRVTPAMEAKVTHRIWEWTDLLSNAQTVKAA
jgi:IS1 family transposase